MHSSTSTFTFILAFASVISASPILHSAPQTAHSLSERSLPSGWKYMGCIAEPSGSRLLTTKIAASPSMTQETCVSLCVGANYGYAGLEFGTECWCGNKPTAPVKVLPDASCSTPCAGKQSLDQGPDFLTYQRAAQVTLLRSAVKIISPPSSERPLPSPTPGRTPDATPIALSSTPCHPSPPSQAPLLCPTLHASHPANKPASSMAARRAATNAGAPIALSVDPKLRTACAPHRAQGTALPSAAGRDTSAFTIAT